MLRQHVTTEERRHALKLTCRALSANQLLISTVTPGRGAVKCPLDVPGSGHICYVAGSPFPELGGHAGAWAREFLCDYVPVGVVRTLRGENTDQALARVLRFETVNALRALLAVRALRPVMASVEALALFEEDVIPDRVVERVISEAASHPLGV